MTERRKAHIDTNILFDFLEGDIFDALFLLPLDFLLSDMIIHEFYKSFSAVELSQKGVQIQILSDKEIDEIHAIKLEHNELSLEDVSLLFLSRKYETMIISNDGPLRRLADTERIEYHGTLWILGELIRLEHLSPEDAAEALKQMLKKGRWLPRGECDKLIKKWESEK
jgi:rRNA-processing protein FCF1